MTIAIDGPVAVGKNAVGSELARRFGYRFLDTGAMYRALTLVALQAKIDLDDEAALSRLAADTDIKIKADNSRSPGYHVLVDGNDITCAITGDEVERCVSLVAKVPGVRKELVAKQQMLARDGGVVMVGRDIGTVVLPEANVKLYLDASAEERAKRRFREMLQRGEKASYEQVLADLRRRDKIDSERTVAPLKAAKDALVINTDGLDVAGVVDKVIRLVQKKT